MRVPGWSPQRDLIDPKLHTWYELSYVIRYKNGIISQTQPKCIFGFTIQNEKLHTDSGAAAAPSKVVIVRLEGGSESAWRSLETRVDRAGIKQEFTTADSPHFNEAERATGLTQTASSRWPTESMPLSFFPPRLFWPLYRCVVVSLGFLPYI